MIYECTDCEHCANFNGGFRVFCLHPGLIPQAVCDYHPVGNDDAYECGEFDDFNGSHRFTWEQLTEAESYSIKKYDEVTYEGIREWCLKQLKGARS